MENTSDYYLSPQPHCKFCDKWQINWHSVLSREEVRDLEKLADDIWEQSDKEERMDGVKPYEPPKPMSQIESYAYLNSILAYSARRAVAHRNWKSARVFTRLLLKGYWRVLNLALFHRD